MSQKKKRPNPVVTREEASAAMARDPTGNEYADLLAARGLGIRAPLTEPPQHAPLPDLFLSSGVKA